MNVQRILPLVGLTLLLAACTTPSPTGPCSSDPETACTRQGTVRGRVENGTVAFKGIPYAAPPVGALRWQAPAPAPAWAGTRDAVQFAPMCPQLSGSEVVGDEDCLALNIWRPQAASTTPRPVMVFLTGGGNHSFSGQGAPVFGGVNYNGELLAPQGVVFVSFNYRLGALGYLAHPALAAAQGPQVSGNYGLLDQIQMLRWVRDNIAAFGGDPNRVFLFGTSAGGGNICALMTAPAAKGLFHGASMQSSVPTGCELPTVAQAQAGTGQRVAQALGCTGADAAACLRGKPMAEVVRAVPGTFGVLPRLYGPVVDGHHLPDQPAALIARGAHAPMPVIIGNSTDETMQFVGGLGPVTDAASYEAAIARVFGADAVARIAGAYPIASFPSPRSALVRLTTDAFFTCQSRRVARLLSAHQSQPVHRYLFSHTLENDPDVKALGAVHTIEHAFLFPWPARYRPSATDDAVKRLMVSHWTQLARTSAVASDPAWPPSAPNDAYLQIGATPAARTGDAGAQCDFWDGIALPQPHL